MATGWNKTECSSSNKLCDNNYQPTTLIFTESISLTKKLWETQPKIVTLYQLHVLELLYQPSQTTVAMGEILFRIWSL